VEKHFTRMAKLLLISFLVAALAMRIIILSKVDEGM
jgi:cell division protein FtsL